MDNILNIICGAIFGYIISICIDNIIPKKSKKRCGD